MPTQSAIDGRPYSGSQELPSFGAALMAGIEAFSGVKVPDPLSVTPAGTTGDADLAAHATVVPIHGVPVLVASLEDVIRSKEAANRPKDLRSLPTLRPLLDEIRRRR
jgi:hypothetical protein